MRIGLDGYSIRHVTATAYQKFEIVKGFGLDGIQFLDVRHLSPTLDAGEISEVASDGRRRGFYVEVGIPGLNPYKPAPAALEVGGGDLLTGLKTLLRAAAAVGPGPVRTFAGGPGDRVRKDVPWTEQLRASTELARQLAPLARDLGVRLAFETHADATSFELLRLIESVGEDVVGICLDTGNFPVVLEDPLAATRRLAPHVIAAHLKDSVVFFTEDGIGTQSRPLGTGIVPVAEILRTLGTLNPDLNLSIEDHERVLPSDIFDPTILALHPDVRLDELVALIRSARTCEQRFADGTLPQPAGLDAIPWEEQAEDRIRIGVANVRRIAREVGI